MKTILVPCDFSEPSMEALKFATRLAHLEGGQIHVVHAVELPALYDSAVVMTFEKDYMKEQRAVAERRLSRTVARWVRGEIKTTMEVGFGGVTQVVERIVESAGADLIVMGTTGASGLKEYTVGSNTEKVVRRSPVPVISVRKPVKEIDNIVFPTRPNGDQEKIVEEVKRLQGLFKAKIHVLYVNTPALFHRDSEMRPSLQAFAKEYSLKNFTINIFNDISHVDGIINFTKELEHPMVVMGTHGRQGISHLVSGSIAEDVVNHIKCPIWTMKIGK